MRDLEYDKKLVIVVTSRDRSDGLKNGEKGFSSLFFTMTLELRVNNYYYIQKIWKQDNDALITPWLINIHLPTHECSLG